MSCNCKSENIDDYLVSDRPKLSIPKLIGKYTLKVLAFIMMLVILPLVNLAIIWFMFNTIVLNKDVNIKPLLAALGNQFKEDKYKEDEEFLTQEEIENLTEEDVELVDVEDITGRPHHN